MVREREPGPRPAAEQARAGWAECAVRCALAGMFSFGNGKYEEAAELYGQAAKQYQLGKNCECPVPPRQPLRKRESPTGTPLTCGLGGCRSREGRRLLRARRGDA